MTAPFNLAIVEAAIHGTQFAGCLHHVVSTTSTSDLALSAVRSGASTGVWVADEQTAGRGRGGHTWHSSPGDGLYASALLPTVIPLSNGAVFSFAVAIAAQTAIASVTGFALRSQLDIRWPNDLILNTPRGSRKCGGILIETAVSASGATLRYAVLGIGINCNHTSLPPELDPVATSLRRESADPSLPLSREALLSALLLELDAEIRSWTSETLPARDPSAHSSWIRGKPVHVAEDGGYTGVTAGLTADGYLKVATADGSLRIVRAGGVREQ